jgi:hypothetical protein
VFEEQRVEIIQGCHRGRPETMRRFLSSR